MVHFFGQEGAGEKIGSITVRRWRVSGESSSHDRDFVLAFGLRLHLLVLLVFATRIICTVILVIIEAIQWLAKGRTKFRSWLLYPHPHLQCALWESEIMMKVLTSTSLVRVSLQLSGSLQFSTKCTILRRRLNEFWRLSQDHFEVISNQISTKFSKLCRGHLWGMSGDINVGRVKKKTYRVFCDC